MLKCRGTIYQMIFQWLSFVNIEVNANKRCSWGQMSRLMTKPTKWHVRPAKTQISLGIHTVWSGSSLSAWRKLASLATHWAHSEDSDQTGRIPRLIWVFAGRTLILLVLSCRGWNVMVISATAISHTWREWKFSQFVFIVIWSKSVTNVCISNWDIYFFTEIHLLL